MTNHRTNEEKKRYMSQYCSILEEYKELLEYKQTKMECVPAFLLSDIPRGSGIGDRVNKIVCSMEAIEKTLARKLEKLTAISLKIEQAIEDLEDSQHRRLMRHRYLQGHKWEQICVMMHYEWRMIHYMHSQALELIDI